MSFEDLSAKMEDVGNSRPQVVERAQENRKRDRANHSTETQTSKKLNQRSLKTIQKLVIEKNSLEKQRA